MGRRGGYYKCFLFVFGNSMVVFYIDWILCLFIYIVLTTFLSGAHRNIYKNDEHEMCSKPKLTFASRYNNIQAQVLSVPWPTAGCPSHNSMCFISRGALTSLEPYIHIYIYIYILCVYICIVCIYIYIYI